MLPDGDFGGGGGEVLVTVTVGGGTAADEVAELELPPQPVRATKTIKVELTSQT